MIQFEIEGLEELQEALAEISNRVDRYVEGGRGYNQQCALAYYNLLKYNILNQTYRYMWPKYNPDYEAWKLKEYPGREFWQLTMSLYHAISVWHESREHTKGGRKAGWAAGLFPSETNEAGVPIDAYAIQMEQGFGNQPARPLFAPTLDDFISDWHKLGRHTFDLVVAKWGKNV